MSLVSGIVSINAITEEEANISIRENITSGIYTSGNLQFSLDESKLPLNIAYRYAKSSENLVSFDVGNTYIEGNYTNRIAFLTFNIEMNFDTTYTIADTMSTFIEENKQINYMSIFSYEEYWTGVNHNFQDDLYYLTYKNYNLAVKQTLGFNGRLPIAISFNTNDFEPTETELDNGDKFLTTGIEAFIDTFHIDSTEMGIIGQYNTIYQMNPIGNLPSNIVSDVNQNDYKTQQDAPLDFQIVSTKISDAGLLAGDTIYYATTNGATGHQAKIIGENGEIDGVNGIYGYDLQLEPQVQIKQQRFSYKEMSNPSSTSGKYIYVDRTHSEESDEHPPASLITKQIERTIGAEVYNVHIKQIGKVVVKLVMSTQFIPKIQLIPDSDSNLEETVPAYYGDMYWDDSLNQWVVDYMLNTQSWWDKVSDAIGNFSIFGISIKGLLYGGIALVVIIFIAPTLIRVFASNLRKK